MNVAGDLLFGCEATWLSELVWNCKTVGGKLLICTSASEKKVSLKILSSKTTIVSVVYFMDLVEDYVGTACGSLDWW